MGTRKLTPRITPARNASSKAVENDSGEGGQSDSLDKGTEDIRLELAGHVEALRFVVGTISVCARALHQQNADHDADIAQVLERTANDKLYDTAERLEAIALGVEYREV